MTRTPQLKQETQLPKKGGEIMECRFTSQSLLAALREERPFPLWTQAAEVLETASRINPNSVPVSILGSASYEFDEDGKMQAAIPLLGKMLRDIDNVVLLTGAMPAVGQDIGTAFCGDDQYCDQLLYLLPHRHGIEPPQNGRLLLQGNSFVDRQFILGMSGAFSVVIGGGPNTCREANVAMQSGRVVLPIACTGGAASGMHFPNYDDIEQQIDLKLAREVALQRGVDQDRYDTICDPCTNPARAVRMVSQLIFDAQ
jgi:hypothetical protein